MPVVTPNRNRTIQVHVGQSVNRARRVRFIYGSLLLLLVIFLVRLFYLQIIKHDYYRKAALQSQLKEYQIPAERGIIYVRDGEGKTPLVLNEKKYTLFADPKYVKDSLKESSAVAPIISGDVNKLNEQLKTPGTRYVILAKKLSKEQKDKIEHLNLKGIGSREASYRTYPQGSLLAQVLGFVDDDGNGKYGIEQSLDSSFRGIPGELKAITDAQGVPLVANKDNIVIAPKAGQDIVLTIDIAMQQHLEEILKAGLDKAKSTSGSALIIDPYSGAIKAMANYPTFNPGEYYKVEDASVFTNASVSSPLEIGSVMKPLTAAAALNEGVVSTNTTYYDPSHYSIDGHTVKNIEEDGGPGTKNVADILQLSLNTGATWLLMQMGGGEVNSKARSTWHDYMTNHYRFGKSTGIEQGYESEGTVPDPNDGFGLNIQYANTAFGQGMSATPLQLGAALAAIINGGTYYRPRLVDQLINDNGVVEQKQPEALTSNIVSAKVSEDIQKLMAHVVSSNIRPKFRGGYLIGGKTGTAQIANPAGGYFEDKYNGMYMGFVGGQKPQYVIVVRVNEPHVAGYAGSGAAQPIFVNLTNMLIDNFGLTPGI